MLQYQALSILFLIYWSFVSLPMFPFFVFYCNFTKKVIFCKAYIVLLDNTKIILYNFVILKNTKNYKRILMSQEEKFLECLAKATKGKKDLSNFEVLNLLSVYFVALIIIFKITRLEIKKF